MKKRLLSVILVMVMLFSLAACGSKSASAKDVLTNMSKAEVGTVEYEFVLGSEGEYIKFKVEASQMDDENGYARVDLLFDMPTAGFSMKEYAPLTEIYVEDGDTVYINVQMVMDFLVELDSQFAMIEAYLSLPSDYIVVTLDEIIELYESMGLDASALEISVPTDEEAELYEKNANAILEVFGDFLDKYVGAAGKDVIKVENGKVSFVMDKDNASDAIAAMAKADLESCIITMAEKLGELNGGVDLVSEIEDEIDGLNDELEDEAKYIKENGWDVDFGELSFEFGMEDKDTVFNMVFAGEGAELNFNMKTTPEKDKNIKAPEDAMDINDIVGILYELGLME